MFITDVTLRDGLQMLSQIVSTDEKLELYQKLSACSLSRIEVTSFVHPKWMPQFADAADFCEALFQNIPQTRPELMAFVPNLKGAERFSQYPIDWACTFVSTSESFNKKNVNMSIDESLEQVAKVIEFVHAQERKVRIYVSTVWGCPYEKEEGFKNASSLLEKVFLLGADEVAPSDTIGVATPNRVRTLLGPLVDKFGAEKIACHFHNTYGLGLANVEAALSMGVEKFDGAMSGVGGCPYAKGASGNLATEDMMYLAYREGRLKNFPTEAIQQANEYLKASLKIQSTSALAGVQFAGGNWYGV